MTAVRKPTKRSSISRAEYEALLDRVEDLEDVMQMRAAEARGLTADALPAPLMRRMLGGEHAIRVWREHRGMTLENLAAASGVAKSYLSEIETGRKPGSIDAHCALAQALNVEIDDLLQAAPRSTASTRQRGRTSRRAA